MVFEQTPAIVALKPYIGHTLGGCGAIELALLYFTLQEGFIPRTFGFDTKDEEIGIVPKQEEMRVEDESICLINHFGFGGNGTVLVTKYGRF